MYILNRTLDYNFVLKTKLDVVTDFKHGKIKQIMSAVCVASIDVLWWDEMCGPAGADCGCCYSRAGLAWKTLTVRIWAEFANKWHTGGPWTSTTNSARRTLDLHQRACNTAAHRIPYGATRCSNNYLSYIILLSTK